MWETRADMTETSAYQESKRLSRQLQTFKTVTNCQDSYKRSRQLQNVKTVKNGQDSYKLLRQLQTVKIVADFQDNCTQFQAAHTTADSCRPLQTCSILSVQ